MKKLCQFAFLSILLILLSTIGVQAAENASPGGVATQTDSKQPGHLLIPPKNLDSSKEYPLYVFMHGLGDCPKCMLDVFYDLLTQQDFYILIPEGPLAYGDEFSWYQLTDMETFQHDAENAESLVKDLVNRVTNSYKIDRNKIYLSGFSQGGRLSFFIGIRNYRMFSTILPIGGVYMDILLDDYTKDAKSLKIDIFHGTKDDVNTFAAMEKTYKKLLAMGMDVSMTTYPLGHTYDEAVLKQVLNRVK